MTNTNGYHVSSSGRLALCQAEERPCPKQGGHISIEDYAHLVAKNDPRTLPAPSESSPKYLKDADATWVTLNKQRQQYEQISREAEAWENEQLVAQGYEKGPKYLKRLAEEREEAKQAYKARLKAMYLEQGVSDTKAGFLAGDAIKSKTWGVTVRKNDRYDENLEAKTTAVRDLVKKDPELKATKDKYNSLAAEEKVRFDLSQQRFGKVNAKLRELNRQDSYTRNSTPTFDMIKRQGWDLQRAHKLAAAGVPESAQAEAVGTLKAEKLSVDSQGRINNAWIEKRNKQGQVVAVERVVGYKPGPGHPGTSGRLVTAEGTEVFSHTHYHSYTSTSSGEYPLLVAEKNGATFAPSQPLSLRSEIDSGD